MDHEKMTRDLSESERLRREDAKTVKLLSLRGRRAKAIIDGFLKTHAFDTGGCRTFYAPTEWRARKEKYGTEESSLLVVVYDGGDLHSIMSREFGDSLYETLDGMLRAEGLYFEECTNWYSAVYEIPGWKKTTP